MKPYLSVRRVASRLPSLWRTFRMDESKLIGLGIFLGIICLAVLFLGAIEAVTQYSAKTIGG